MRITVKKVNGKWEVNGKPYNQIQGVEKKFFEEFLVAMKLGYKFEIGKAITAENYVGEKL